MTAMKKSLLVSLCALAVAVGSGAQAVKKKPQGVRESKFWKVDMDHSKVLGPVDRVKAAVDARNDASFVIMARTDAAAVEGIDSAIERAVAYVEAGADMIFPEAMTELGMYRQFAEAVGVPVLANITEFGQTPLFSVEELKSAGCGMVLYPLSAFRAANKAAETVYQAIRRDGHQKNVLDTMQTRMELYDRINYHAFENHLDALFAAKKA